MVVKQVKGVTPWILLLAAIGIGVLGVLTLMLPDSLVEVILILALTVLLLVYGVVRAAQCFHLKKHLEGIISLILCWGAAAVVFFVDYCEDVVAVVPSVIIGAVSLLLGILRAAIAANCFANKYTGRLRNTISAIMCISFGLFLIINPIENFALLSLVAGFYLLFYSVTLFGDFFASVFQLDLSENRRRRRTHHALPNVISAVKPSNMIKDINRHIQHGDVTSGILIEEKADTTLKQEDVNADILVHLTTQGANKFGHVDIALGDTVYSYGTYDSSKDKYGGFVSQGCFIIVPKVPYLKYCLTKQKKYVIGFGAALSQVQYDSIKKRIEELLTHCEPFESEYEKAIRENRDGSEYTDPASNITRDVGGEVYTVVSGPFRRYFGINTNCVHVADWLLSDSGIDAISFSSLRTPGAYYAMLQNMFNRKNTRIIRKTTYIIADDIKPDHTDDSKQNTEGAAQ